MSHVVTWRGCPTPSSPFGFWHHGILCPDRSVIHHVRGKSFNVRIERTSIFRFFSGPDDEWLPNTSIRSPKAFIVKHQNGSPRPEILQRAQSKIGSGSYNILFNNCEHFVMWCVYGNRLPISRQSISFSAAVLVGAASAGPTGAVIFGLSERLITSLPVVHRDYLPFLSRNICTNFNDGEYTEG